MAPSIQEHIVVIKEVVQDTPQVRLLRVSRPAGWDFLCGQFFMVSLADDPHTRVARAYSAASSPLEEEYIEIGFDKVGVLTTRLFGLKAGDALRFKGPYGKFFFDNPSKEDIVLIGAGTGITPLMSIARYCVEKSLPNAVRLLYSVRTPEAIVYRKELEERKRQNPHFDYSVTVTRPEESAERWHGKTGRVDEKMLAELVANPDNSVAFICGPKEFVFSVIGMLERIGVGKERIKTDVWG